MNNLGEEVKKHCPSCFSALLPFLLEITLGKILVRAKTAMLFTQGES